MLTKLLLLIFDENDIMKESNEKSYQKVTVTVRELFISKYTQYAYLGF